MSNQIEKSREDYGTLYRAVRRKLRWGKSDRIKKENNVVNKVVTETIKIDNPYVPLNILLGGYIGYGEMSPRIWICSGNNEFEILPNGYKKNGKRTYSVPYLNGTENPATKNGIIAFFDRLKNDQKAMDFMHKGRKNFLILRELQKKNMNLENFIENLLKEINTFDLEKLSASKATVPPSFSKFYWCESDMMHDLDKIGIFLRIHLLRKHVGFDGCEGIEMYTKIYRSLEGKYKELTSADVMAILSEDSRSETMKNGRYMASLDDRICYVLDKKTAKDEKIANYLFELPPLPYNKKINDILLGTDGVTDCHKVKGSDRNYFLKRMAIAKMPFSDYEIYIAEILKQRGLYVKKPRGIAIVNTIPYVLFDYAENSTDLGSHYYVKESKDKQAWLSECLKKNNRKIFTELGKYVGSMFLAGVYDQDMAKRNFMVEFHPNGTFKNVFIVDFEKTIAKDYLSAEEKDTSLRQLTEDMTEDERTHFLKSYNAEMHKFRL